MNRLCAIFLTFLCNQVVNSAKILAIFPSPGYSQYFVAEPLLISLAEKGHEVTLIGFYKPNNATKNLHPVTISDLKPFAEEMEEFHRNIFSVVRNILETYSEMTTEAVLRDPQVQKLIRSNETFDAVILEQVANEPLMAFADHFDAPLIVFSTIAASDWVNHLVGNPSPFSYVPHTFSGFSTSMGIWQRAQNLLIQVYSLLVKYFILVPRYDRVIKENFPNAPPIEDVMHNVSLVLLNSNPAATPPYPKTANMVEIGGFHIRHEALESDVKEVLDGSENGVVYFSMGTNVDLQLLGGEKVKEVLGVFSEMKESVLWKFKNESMEKTRNVKIRKWLPQRAILGHKNVKVFISHCGLISSIESMYFGVPMICIPVFVDQTMNAAILEDKGVAVTIQPQRLNKGSLKAALDEVLNNAKYTANAQKYSGYFKDAPIDPMDLAIYWIEFVVRHKGAPHLSNPGLRLRWYEYCFLDVSLLFLSGLTCFWLLIQYFLHVQKKKEKLL